MSWNFLQLVQIGLLHFARNLSSCRIQTALRQSSVASTKLHRVNILTCFNKLQFSRHQNSLRDLTLASILHINIV